MALVRFSDAFGNQVLVNPEHVVAVTKNGGNTAIALAVAVHTLGPENERNRIVVTDSVSTVEKKLAEAQAPPPMGALG